MLCYFKGEYRGCDARVSKKGTEYYIIHFEDLETCKPFEFYSKVAYLDVVKGQICEFITDMKTYNGKTSFELVNVITNE